MAIKPSKWSKSSLLKRGLFVRSFISRSSESSTLGITLGLVFTIALVDVEMAVTLAWGPTMFEVEEDPLSLGTRGGWKVDGFDEVSLFLVSSLDWRIWRAEGLIPRDRPQSSAIWAFDRRGILTKDSESSVQFPDH